jgi:hypothetical protein
MSAHRGEGDVTRTFTECPLTTQPDMRRGGSVKPMLPIGLCVFDDKRPLVLEEARRMAANFAKLRERLRRS